MTGPRIGFVGAGWVGLQRLQAIREAEAAAIVAGCEPDEQCRATLREVLPDVTLVDDYAALLAMGLDGIVIATPNALHGAQTMAALESGHAVFCQKPLGRDAVETASLLKAARQRDRLVVCDLSYRQTRAAEEIRRGLRAGEIGRPYALDLVFHHTLGPGKPWYFERSLAGGGCVIDLGIHLVDLALWLLDFPQVTAVTSRLYASGVPVRRYQVEDFAEVQLALEGSVVARLSCSWRAHAGRRAQIGVRICGTEGALSLRNRNGSLDDFVAERHEGTTSERLAEPPDAWRGRAAVTWARQLAISPRFDPEAARLVPVASVLDAIYAEGWT